MKAIIHNQQDLDTYIKENGDCNPETNYFSQDESGKCFVIFGCTYASEAFRFVSDDTALVITDDNYDAEIEKQNNADHPELEGFELK